MEIDKDLDNLLLDLDILGVQEIIEFNTSCSSDEQYQKERTACIKWNDSSDGLRILSTGGTIDPTNSEKGSTDFSYLYYLLSFKGSYIKFRFKTSGNWWSSFGNENYNDSVKDDSKFLMTLYLDTLLPDSVKIAEFTITWNHFLEAFSYYENVTEATMEIAEHKIGGWLRNRGGRKGDGLGKLLKRYENG